MDFSASAGKSAAHHDTHAMPPIFIQKEHWKYQSMKRADLDADPSIANFQKGLTEEQNRVWKSVYSIPASQIEGACTAYSNAALGKEQKFRLPFRDVTVFEHAEFPGLQVIPGLLPPETQILFTSQLMHRDLADPAHKINLQAEYEIPYPSLEDRYPSFFLRPRASPSDNLIPKPPLTPTDEESKSESEIIDSEAKPGPQGSQAAALKSNPESNINGSEPKPDPTPAETSTALKPLNTEQFLTRKLRWLTLGDQYDWPTRSYAQHTTPFPPDLSLLVTTLFPHITPQSGVVLLYGSKDFMPVHRDVSEQCSRALASFSLGCDGIFLIARGEDVDDGESGTKEEPKVVKIRVRSGDVVHLDREARWAWHAMARTIGGTCPEWLAEWPVGTPGVRPEEERRLAVWRGWMRGKRINVSCRQVWD